MKRLIVLKATVFLLVLFGVMAASFDGVASGGSPGKYPEDQYMVSAGEAMDHAFVSALIGTFSGMEGLKGWSGAQLYAEPVRIYDVNGKLLFYEFSVVEDKKTVGVVWASASKVLGAPPVYIMQPGIRSYDPDQARSEALRIASTKYPTHDVIKTLLVCYSFPRMGIMVTLRHSKTTVETKIIIDAADYKLVPPVDEKYEGTGYWSFYNRVPDAIRKQRIEGYERFYNTLVLAIRQAEVNTRARLDRTTFQRLTSTIMLTGVRATVPLTLHGQETNDYCALATGQMILEYHGYDYTQASIAPTMGYHPGGCSQDGQVSGYESLSHNNIDAISDLTAVWSEARAEIDANRPLKSGVPHHARACAGYSSCSLFGQRLYIYDPWGQTDPGLPHEGRIYWERWDEATHTNWIYLRPR
jgi:hypothetical protein